MATNFAALEARLNRAVLSHLSNVVATVNALPVTAIFDSSSAIGSVGPYGMATTAPQLTIATASVPASPVGLPVVANGVNYLIAEHMPDGTGISVLVLEKA